MFKKKFITTLFFLNIILFSNLESATFHAILVGDTKDKDLKYLIRKDLRRIKDHVGEIFASLDIESLEEMTYTGRDSNAKILHDLSQRKIGPDDIIFFYFSGHGFYTKNSSDTCWPFLYLSPDDAGICLFHVMNILAGHHPRLLICLADCCNNVLKNRDLPKHLYKMDPPKRQKPLLSNKLNHLFLEHRGVILISSASPGFYAEGTDQTGSNFTSAYLRIFRKAVSRKNEEMSWDSILSEVKNQLWERQQPQYQFFNF